MSRSRSVHRCTDCGAPAATWLGRCPGCGAWNTLVEEPSPSHRGARPASSRDSTGPVPSTEVAAEAVPAVPTGVPEVDRVLGGGLVPGSVTLVGGEPGIGKSTLLLQLAAELAGPRSRVLYVSAEESPTQVRARAARLDGLSADLWLDAEADVVALGEHLDRCRPDVLVVDSIQTVHDPALGSAPGSVAQVRECAARLAAQAKQRGLTTLLVGHVTKEGALAGPRVLEHLVDTVLSLEGDRHHGLRLLRATKHRFGPTGELGVLEMTGLGLVAVDDPSGRFLADRRPGVAGSAVAAALEGQRPLVCEVQALVAPSSAAVPRRSAQGLDPGRLAVVLAVLERRLGWAFGALDVHALAVGGARLVEPATDLALALAVASSRADVPLPEQLVVSGEVGLGGEIRQVPRLDHRLAEAARLGFTAALVPGASSPPASPPLALARVETVADAVLRLGVAPDVQRQAPTPLRPGSARRAS